LAAWQKNVAVERDGSRLAGVLLLSGSVRGDTREAC
jgi:hypothetical protein